MFLLIIFFLSLKINFVLANSADADEMPPLADEHNYKTVFDFKDNEPQQCGMCNQQSLRSACAYAQSDQSLC